MDEKNESLKSEIEERTLPRHIKDGLEDLSHKLSPQYNPADPRKNNNLAGCMIITMTAGLLAAGGGMWAVNAMKDQFRGTEPESPAEMTAVAIAYLTLTPTFATPTLAVATSTPFPTAIPTRTNTPAPTNTPTIIPTLTPTPIAFVPGVYYRETTFEGRPAFEFLRFTSQGQVYQLGVSGVPKGDVKTAFNIVDPKLNATDPASAKGPYSILGNVITSMLKTQTGEIYKFEGAIIDASQLSLNKTSPDGKFEAMVLFALLLGGG